MGKRAGQSPSKARKRGRGRGRRRDGDSSDDEEVVAQMRRKQILDNEDDDEVMAEYREEGGIMLDDIYIPPKITRNEHPCTGERLVIEKIVCENFKSYGGLKEMGPFHKSFSAIIGPNGNGKSNIIDAMLFVFGYRASKIRCKKVSTLIHKSELLPDLRSCAVTVHFVKIIDDGNAARDDYDIVENSQITVMRRAQANNNSSYSLDGKSVKFQEVATFLKANGIDIVHNRFLILQGEVEQIAQMPPISPNGQDTGLLEFLEEVIGTKRYIRPLAQLDQRVEVLDYERDEKLQRVDMAEKEKVALAEPVKKAKDFLRDQNSQTKYQHMLCQVRAHHAKKTVAEKEKVTAEMEAKLGELQTRLDEINKINSVRKEEFQKAEKLFKTAEREYNKAKKALETADQHYIQLNQELQRTNEARKKLLKDSVKLEQEIEKLKGLPESHQGDIDQLKKRKAELDGEIDQEEAAVKGDLEKLNLKVEVALKQKEIADKEFARLRRIRDEKKSIFDKSQKELANYKERGQVEQKKLTDLETELEALKESVKRKEKEGRTSMGHNQLGAKEETLRGLEEEVKKLSTIEANKRNVFEQTRGDHAQAQDSLQGNNNLDMVDRALLEAKEDGMFPGLFGRLKNLATIPEKYNVAATMASGMLEHWITDNDETAGRCIGYLREKNLGVQNFVCISRVQDCARSCKQRFDTPANSNRIFDLLSINKPELAAVYYKAFRNTLVADTIDIATQVSCGGPRRERVVTLKGEIVEATGSMQGGGRACLNGKFNSKKTGVSVTKQQLANLKQRHDEAGKEFQTAQEARQTAEGKTRALSEQIQDLKRKINNYNSDLAALKAQLPLKEANLNEQKKRTKECATVPQVLKEKEKFLEKANSEYEESLKPYEASEENAASMAEKVKELQVNKKNEITKKLDKLKEMLKKVMSEMNKKIVELKNCETNRKKSETKLETVRKEIEKLQKSMAKMNDERKDIEAKGKEIKEKEQEFAEKVQVAKKEFDEVKGHSHEFQTEENKLNKDKVAFENQYANALGEVNGCKNLLKAVNANIQTLTVKDIPEERVEPLKILTEEEIQELTVKDLDHKVQKYKQKLNRDDRPNLNILEDYKTKVDQLYQRIKELEEATQKRDQFREQYCKLDRQRATEFMEGFALISSRLKEMFRMISMGGDAELEVVDILDLFGCGVQFSVRPARKTWKKISNLSGGEKTLASLSLVFALHHFKPSPFYVMDEIDAALDFKNVSIIANYIKDRTKFTQFIIISLRSNMFELADSLLGVYKVDNMSYSIHIGVKRLVAELKKKYEVGRACLGEVQDPNRQDQKGDVPGPNGGLLDVNLSAIVDEHDDGSIEMAVSPIPAHDEGDTDDEVIPESPPTILERSSVTRKEQTVGSSTGGLEDDADLFEDMAVGNNSVIDGPGPLAASTPFISGKRPSAILRESQGEGSNHAEVTVTEDKQSKVKESQELDSSDDDSFASCDDSQIEGVSTP